VEADALYIRLREGDIDHTVEISNDNDVWADVDDEGNVLGIEILLSSVDFEVDVPDRIPAKAIH
jgi:uncharacterized protein YuzE